ncbi:hypothetical protein IFM12276_46940 [Nocardia sputorum]|uniref:Uncharacterized protein n=1 Tax=Nocardia sputorum TaxID=2984338 RepID=A0ABN6U8T1_9NOCA|nr:hypothetical protein IFM12276_46940 [Nocardia sputorum]
MGLSLTYLDDLFGGDRIPVRLGGQRGQNANSQWNFASHAIDSRFGGHVPRPSAVGTVYVDPRTQIANVCVGGRSRADVDEDRAAWRLCRTNAIAAAGCRSY